MRIFVTLSVLLLFTLISCSPSPQKGIGGGFGESLVLECSAEQQCPEGYECVAQEGQTGLCQQIPVTAAN